MMLRASPHRERRQLLENDLLNVVDQNAFPCSRPTGHVGCGSVIRLVVSHVNETPPSTKSGLSLVLSAEEAGVSVTRIICRSHIAYGSRQKAPDRPRSSRSAWLYSRVCGSKSGSRRSPYQACARSQTVHASVT